MEPMNDAPPPDLAGTLVAQRYRVERLLGQGGMGSVWAGKHMTLGHFVAIKFIHPALAESAEALRRFDIEARAAARIKSRHAAAVHDHGVTPDGRPYIVMEYLEGETLEHAIRRRGILPLDEVAEIVGQTARALDVAHAAGVVHRDLKPDNVFLANDRETSGKYTVKIVDFGIAKIVQDEAKGSGPTQAGTVLGTPHYMSPEALTGSAPVSAVSDVWSLAACAFAATCGRAPFEGGAIGDVVLKVCAAPMPVPSKINPSLPRAFDDWFARACARDPARRFASAKELADALYELEKWAAEARDQNAYELRPATQSVLEEELAQLRPAGRGWVLGGVLAGMAVTLGGLGWFVMQRTRAASETATSVAASAQAIVAAENQKKLEEAERHFWASQASASASASPALDAGAPDARVSTKRRRP